MTRGEGTGGIGHAGVARQMKNLATASPKVHGAAVTAAARIREPTLSPELIEAGGMMPNLRQAALSHIVEAQSRQRVSEMAGESKPFRVYHDEPASHPSIQALGYPE